jgi:hypothetical protein
MWSASCSTRKSYPEQLLLATGAVQCSAEVSYHRLPSFFTDEYGLRMEYVGWIPPGAPTWSSSATSTTVSSWPSRRSTVACLRA